MRRADRLYYIRNNIYVRGLEDYIIIIIIVCENAEHYYTRTIRIGNNIMCCAALTVIAETTSA